MCLECWEFAEPAYDQPESGHGEDGERRYVRWDLTEECCVVFSGISRGRASFLVNTTDRYVMVRVTPGDLRCFGAALIELADESER